MTSAPTSTAPEYWQSVDQWMDSARFEKLMKDEFPEDAAEWLDPVSRRKFLGIMGASVALAGAVGCNPSLKPAPQKKTLPYVRQPDQILPGVPLFFATSMPQAGGVGMGLIVKSHEGRPIKCEGNPNHPGSHGAIDHQALAAPLTFYDPDRSQMVRLGGTAAKFESVLLTIKDELAKRPGGAGVRIVTEATTSPSFSGLMNELLTKYPAAKWVQYEPAGDHAAAKAANAAFGKPVNVFYDYSKPAVILSLDADFLSGPGGVHASNGWAAKRKVSTVDAEHELIEIIEEKTGKHGHPKPEEIVGEATEDLSRLYVVEGALTSTGAVADHRLPLKPSLVEAFARLLAAELGVAGGSAAAVTAATDLPESARRWIAPLAKDLLAHKEKALVVPGESQSPAVHLLAHAMNAALEAGKAGIVKFTAPLQPRFADRVAELKDLVKEMADGKVEVLFLSNVNPAYDAPADLDFAKAIDAIKAKKGVIVHHGLYQDETAAVATYHVPAAHFLESWGDVRAHDGTVSIQQPLIAPLYSGKSALEFFATLFEASVTDGHDRVHNTAVGLKPASVTGETETFWEKGLRAGVLEGTGLAAVDVAAAVNLDKLNDPAFTQAPIKGVEIQFRACPVLHDGRQGNNGWLHELPKPITNLTWDNAALVSPRTAADLKSNQRFMYMAGERGRTETDLVKLIVNGREVIAAILVQPGMADDTVVLHLGYGRRRAGRVGGTPDTNRESRSAGCNAYLLRSTDAPWSAPVEVKLTGETTFLAIAGAHAAMESRRPVRHATTEEFKKDLVFAQIPGMAPGEFKEIRTNTPGTPENLLSLGIPSTHSHGHGDHGHEGHDPRLKKLSLYSSNPIRVNGKDANAGYRRWAMTIDLGSCTGCGACTLACVAENNIPVVGKDQVSRGRAMHWIRIDRYYSIPGQANQDDELGGYGIKDKDRAQRLKESAAIRTHFQPVPCQQCEKAPCEVVCPVGATVHSADGLNDMAYNRCVGTRYCSNNCPYKVRRFNFLQYTDYSTDTLKLLNNPEVTVRTRGVMEKCTYCVQRIRNAEIEAEREWDKRGPDGKPVRPLDSNGRPKIADGEVRTACEQACPSAAIVFGDLSDPKSRVLKTKAEAHNYGLLAEYNTAPRTSYLAAIRNPNPDMPKGA